MMSGLPMVQPSTNWTGAGLSWAAPSGAPSSAHAASVAIWSSLRTLAFLKCPTVGSANHGGIVLDVVALAMARAYGLASLYVMKDIGAMASGRWHSWQFC